MHYAMVRRDTDVNWIKSGVKLLYVEMPTLTVSTGMAQGVREGSWTDINSHFLGRYGRGETISPLSTFFYVGATNIRRRRFTP